MPSAISWRSPETKKPENIWDITSGAASLKESPRPRSSGLATYVTLDCSIVETPMFCPAWNYWLPCSQSRASNWECLKWQWEFQPITLYLQFSRGSLLSWTWSRSKWNVSTRKFGRKKGNRKTSQFSCLTSEAFGKTILRTQLWMASTWQSEAENFME